MRMKKLGWVILPLVSVAVLLLLWEVIVVVFRVQPLIVPRPLAAIRAVTDNWGTLWPLVAGILRETVYGFVGGTVLGFLFAVAMSKIRVVRRLLYPQLIVSQAVPVIAIAFPLTAILGFGSIRPIVAIVIWIVFFPVTVNVLDGLSHVDQDLLNLARVYSATRWRTFWNIEVPATVSPLFTGLKIGATYAITGAYIGESVSSTSGSNSSIAFYVQNSNGQLDPAAVYGVTMLLSVIGVAFFLAVAGVEVWSTPWLRRSTTRRPLLRRIVTTQIER
jgi:ABC-type nitrate/sulfonate/bicarbonate transport system permease component